MYKATAHRLNVEIVMKKTGLAERSLKLSALLIATSVLIFSPGCCKRYTNPDDTPLIAVRTDYRTTTKFKRTQNTPHSVTLQ